MVFMGFKLTSKHYETGVPTVYQLGVFMAMKSHSFSHVLALESYNVTGSNKQTHLSDIAHLCCRDYYIYLKTHGPWPYLLRATTAPKCSACRAVVSTGAHLEVSHLSRARFELATEAT
jgi:hypothetical protein